MTLHKIVNGEIIELTQEEIDLIELQNQEWAASQAQIEYRKKRQEEYPNPGDQLDMIYWDGIRGTSEWEELITSIKQKYPKPT